MAPCVLRKANFNGLNQAKDTVGKLVNVDIGIPAPERFLRLAEDGDFRELLGPRKNFSNKGDYGYVALMGGCTAYSGAAKLANLSPHIDQFLSFHQFFIITGDSNK